jgi:RNA polymerase sigma-70 factor, ECF subfamily
MTPWLKQVGDSTPTKIQIPDQRELIRRAQEGDQQAFTILYTSHKRRIYSLCLRMVHNVEDAEDLMQEAFLQVYRKLNTFRGESAFSTWLHRVAVNVVLMSLRKKPWRETSIEEVAGPADNETPPPVLGTEDELLTHSVDRIALERALGCLPPGYRLVFALHDILGYEHQEMAEILGCSAGNCKSQLHKARLKLRRVLREQGKPEHMREAA